MDILVLAAVQTTGATPESMRALLHTVFKRAMDVGLTVASAEAGLRAGVAAATGARGEPADAPRDGASARETERRQLHVGSLQSSEQ